VLNAIARCRTAALVRRNQLRFFGPCQTLSGQKAFAAFLRTLFRDEWVVYAQPPFGGPQHVLQYLARYTHRVAISNHRLLEVTDREVTFRWKAYAHGSKQRALTLPHEGFLRRFLQPVLPTGFPRLRYFGFLAHCRRRLLPLCRHLLAALPPPTTSNAPAVSFHRCPRCQSPMRILERLTAQELSQEKHARIAPLDSS
jgi:hypothetical protein